MGSGRNRPTAYSRLSNGSAVVAQRLVRDGVWARAVVVVMLSRAAGLQAAQSVSNLVEVASEVLDHFRMTVEGDDGNLARDIADNRRELGSQWRVS